jgi:hypothetical protein
MKKYIYTGEYFHQTNEDYESNDIKIGLTKDFTQRERELTRTNGPIKYEMTSVWQISIDNIENPAFIVENICHSFFYLFRYDGNEWFNTELLGKSAFYTCLSRGLASLNQIPGVKITKMSNITGNDTDETVENRRRLVTKLGNSEGDPRIVELCAKLGESEVELRRNYKGNEVSVTVTADGMYHFMGIPYNTHNKMYNNGIVLEHRGVKGGSGNSSLNPYTIYKTGKKINDIIELK